MWGISGVFPVEAYMVYAERVQLSPKIRGTSFRVKCVWWTAWRQIASF